MNVWDSLRRLFGNPAPAPASTPPLTGALEKRTPPRPWPFMAGGQR
jgi:hypothetical protein